MIDTLTDIVLTITGFQLLLLAAVLLTREAASPVQRNLLAAFLLSKACLLLRWFAYRFGILHFDSSGLFYFMSVAGFFLLAPVLYLYVRSLCARDFRLQRRHLAHLIPFLLVMLLIMGTVLIWDHADEEHPLALALALQAHFWKVFWTLNLIQILIYLLAMVRSIRAYQAELRETHSAIERIDLRWLMSLLTLAALHWLFIVSRAMLGILNVDAPSLMAALNLFSITIFLVFTTALVVKGIGHLKMIPGLGARPRHAESRMNADDLRSCVERLDRLMTTHHPYLQPALTIDQLAARLGSPAHVISRVINSAYRQNFFNYINQHRIEAAKAQLRDPDCNSKTMLQILHEVGFNSKSAFNEAFKRHAGMTPSAFRRQAQGTALT